MWCVGTLRGSTFVILAHLTGIANGAFTLIRSYAMAAVLASRLNVNYLHLFTFRSITNLTERIWTISATPSAFALTFVWWDAFPAWLVAFFALSEVAQHAAPSVFTDTVIWTYTSSMITTCTTLWLITWQSSPIVLTNTKTEHTLSINTRVAWAAGGDYWTDQQFK